MHELINGLLAGSELLILTATLIVYLAADLIYRRCNCHPLANPVLSSIILLIFILHFCDIDYITYFKGAEFINFLLGPAIVALAIPLYRAYDHIKRAGWVLVLALISGCFIAITTVVVIGWACGGTKEIVLSLAPKSITTPIAMSVSAQIGGISSLTAVLVILTGVFGALISTPILNFFAVTDPRARGFATGLIAHAIGTSHKLKVNEVAGAFAGLAMGLNGIATAVFLPLLMPVLLHWLD